MKKLLIKVALWLVIVNVFALAVHNRFNLTPDTAYTWITPEGFPVKQSWDVVDMHNRWDSYWYLDIVNNGYYLRTDNTLANVVFFPLYPTLIKIVGTILPASSAGGLGNFVLAGWLISMTFLLLASAYFYKLVKEFHPEIDPELPILLMLIFPTAFFFNVIYTESLFLFLTIAVFYYAFKRRFYLAGLFAFLGALTHSNGAFFALPILWEIVRVNGWRNLLPIKEWKKLIPVLFAPFGSFLFLTYDYLKFGDPMLFFKIQSAWGRSFSINWDHFSFFSHPSIVNMFIDIFLAVFIITATILVWKKLSPLYSIFMSLTLFAAFSSGTLMSVGRYSLVMFPLFILLAKIKDRTWLLTWVMFSVLFFALDIMLWTNNYWAG